ncbi:MAG TPA: MarR family transcriptional regulator [Gammaproteobacteria bacterium]|nr:MarR family transcriptional regulator [Gammaproteobacteria bacterium]
MADPVKHRKPRRRLLAAYHVEATAFLHEILNVADRLREARGFDGEPAFPFGRQAEVLRAIERCGGAPTFSDLGRLLRVSRQAARVLAVAAERRGVVELFTSPDDRRAIQVALSPRGRRVLEARRMPQFAWVFTLLGGLEPDAMRATSRVLRVIRQRLERDAAERRRAELANTRRG